MNTILVVSALSMRMMLPQYVVQFPTEQECRTAAEQVKKTDDNRHTFVCVPAVVAKPGKLL